MIEALAANRANHAFDKGSLPRRPWRGKYMLNAHVLNLLRKVVAKDSIAISQEVVRCGVPREGVTKLLGRPLRRRVIRDIEMEYPAPVVSKHQERVQDLKPDGRHGEEIDGHQALELIVEERPPGLRGWLPVADHVLAHAGRADFDAEFE
jgi:hypothetical protein